jgi:hypothetical protein
LVLLGSGRNWFLFQRQAGTRTPWGWPVAAVHGAWAGDDGIELCVEEEMWSNADCADPCEGQSTSMCLLVLLLSKLRMMILPLVTVALGLVCQSTEGKVGPCLTRG